ncbi:bifunctional metallophosphatase/5'-nucleotidase [Zoogloea oleivorans]|uniref:Bifunctional metallophosphatase/5'-nucleotidase n=1 Tax=Zoogloea oleivorans TaxID=1552750 RepID=A0A6C2D6M7_9RHOO|nr:5'-nucleotidase C-terminal domain-containing protein [Zoogloea oleivorans]TYC61423.1 bifunctional metallophosphatase/5'-nucleotidase [Zoogloea oleivorans]
MTTSCSNRTMPALALSLCALALSACGGSDGSNAKALDLTILHINDHHSHLDAESTTLTLKNAAGASQTVTVELGGFARVTAAFEALAGASKNVLKLHAGDAITGDLYFTQSEGKADADMMNTVCFDAFSIGNHEFDSANAGLVKFIDYLHAGTCKTPVLSANIQPAAGSPLASRMGSYKIIEKDGEKIGVVGLTVKDKTRFASRPDATTQFSDETTSAQSVIDELKQRGVNKIVLLSHLGYAADKTIAAKLSGVDVIIGGDSHTLLGPDSMTGFGLTPSGAYPTQTTDKDGKKVCVAQAWQYSYVVGALDVKFDASGNVTSCSGKPQVLLGDTYKVGSVSASDADATAYRSQLNASGVFRITTPSAAATTVLAPYKAAKDALGLQVAGATTDNLCLRRVPGAKRDTSRSSLGDVCNKDATVIAHGGDIQQLVAEAFLEQGQRFGGADISLQNAGGVRIDIGAGDITVGKVYTLLPFKNTLYRLVMTGAQMKAALEDGVDSVLNGTGSGAYPYTGGLRFAVDMNQAKGSRISNLELRDSTGTWKPFDLAASYKVITNNFTADGGDKYDTLKTIPAAQREDTFLDYADSFLQYVRSKSPLAKPAVANRSTQQYTETP